MNILLDEIDRELAELRRKKRGVFDFGPFRSQRYKRIRVLEDNLMTAKDSLEKYMKKSGFLHSHKSKGLKKYIKQVGLLH